jgi:MoaA/NifB/PqqE/SkfB family radical SAM enzyme
MQRVDIKIGFNCNNNCVFCVQGKKRERLKFKTKDEVEKSLKESYRQGKDEVVFTGGEPSLHPDFLDFIALAKKIGFKEIQIQTNGRMFAYYDFCLKTVKAGATQFSPALHGSTAKIHDELTKAPGSFEQTVQAIKNFKKLNQYILTNTVITGLNYKDLPNIAGLLVDLGVDQFQFAFVHILGTAAENKDWLVPRKSEVAPYVKPGLDIGARAGKKVSTEAIPYCLMTGYEDYISEDFIPETRIYDIDFVVEKYEDYRRSSGKAKREECKNCKFYKKCEGPWKEYVEMFGWDEFKPV